MKNEKMTLEELQVQTFVTSLDSEVEKHVMGGRQTDPSDHPTHTVYTTDPYDKTCTIAVSYPVAQ